MPHGRVQANTRSASGEIRVAVSWPRRVDLSRDLIMACGCARRRMNDEVPLLRGLFQENGHRDWISEHFNPSIFRKS